MVAKWSGILSTTEPRNDIGILNVRQGNKNSEIAEFQIIENNKPYDLTGFTVLFCASFGMNQVEKPALVINAKEGKISYTFDDDAMQQVGRNKGYFSVKKAEAIIDSTQEFEYRIQSSIYSRLIDAKSYIFRLNELMQLLEDFVTNSQTNFSTWFDSVKEILYGVDPGGNILRELIEARNGILGKVFPSLKARLDTFETETTAQFQHNTNEIIYSAYEVGGVVTITDDDGHGLFMSKMKPVLDSNSVKATLCVAGVEVGKAGIMSIEQLKALELDGFEVASHGFDGKLVDLGSDHLIETDLIKSREFVLKNDFKAKDILIYNGGNWNNADGRKVKRIVRKYFKYAFNNFGDNNLFVDNFQIGRADFNAKTLEELKVLVDECAINKTYLTLMVHSWDTTFDSVKLDNIIKYIKSKNVKILKATEAVKLKANYQDYGDAGSNGSTRINANGQLSSNIAKVDSNSINKSIVEYPYGLSINTIDSYIATAMTIPSGLKDYTWSGYGGKIFVVKESTTVCYQHLRLNYSKNLSYTRKWDNSAKNWTEFVPDFSYIHIGAIGNADINKNIVNFDVKTVTEFHTTGGSNTPSSKAGVIQVHRGSDDAYGYRDFTPHDTAQKYKSIWNNGSKTWGSFVLYNA